MYRLSRYYCTLYILGRAIALYVRSQNCFTLLPHATHYANALTFLYEHVRINPEHSFFRATKKLGEWMNWVNGVGGAKLSLGTPKDRSALNTKNQSHIIVRPNCSRKAVKNANIVEGEHGQCPIVAVSGGVVPIIICGRWGVGPFD